MTMFLLHAGPDFRWEGPDRMIVAPRGPIAEIGLGKTGSRRCPSQG